MIHKLLDGLVASSSDEMLLQVATQFSGAAGNQPDLIAALADKLARSGISLTRPQDPSGDVASTGGPGSLSTLLGPLYLVSAGVKVPALGIPGRPAGGIDCLAQIPGYRTRLTESEFQAALDECGYAHFQPTPLLAPLDERLFVIRQRSGFQAVPSLVIASLLSKKLAVGLSRFTIDVRVMPYGNFGRNWAEATENASLLRQVAANLGMSAETVLTECRFPQQPYIGRRESLWALQEVFSGEARGDLELHAMRCRAMAQLCLSSSFLAPSCGREIRRAFVANLEAQGSSEIEFEKVVAETSAAHDKKILASSSGYLSVNLQELRTTIVRAQQGESSGIEFPDPIGIRILKRSGEFVAEGEPIATVRATGACWAATQYTLAECIGTKSAPSAAGFEGVM